MKFDKVLEGRRSIRRYTDELVEKDEIKAVLKAANLAPSWKNSQCWRWHVVTNDALLAQIRENALPATNAAKVEQAPCLIVACYKQKQSGLGNDGEYANEIEEGWSCFDLGLACENLCLEAFRLSLGTLIMGIRNESVLREILTIPEDETVVCVIALGHPDIEPPMPKRLKLKETAVFYE